MLDRATLLHVSVKSALCGRKAAASKQAPGENPSCDINSLLMTQLIIHKLDGVFLLGRRPVSDLLPLYAVLNGEGALLAGR
jgi:hypothetical protein